MQVIKENEYGAVVESYWRAKTEKRGAKPAPVTFRPLQILQSLDGDLNPGFLCKMAGK